MAWRDEVEQIYYITHSSTYEAVINALEFLSPGANAIADAISWIPGLSQYAEPLRQISRAGSTMREVRYASEEAYRAIQVVEVAPQYLTYGMIFGLVLIVIGMVLTLKARKKEPYLKGKASSSRS